MDHIVLEARGKKRTQESTVAYSILSLTVKRP